MTRIKRLIAKRTRGRTDVQPLQRARDFIASPQFPAWASAISTVAHLAGLGRLARRLDAMSTIAAAAQAVRPSGQSGQPFKISTATVLPAVSLVLDMLYRRRVRTPAILGSLALLGGMYVYRRVLFAAPPRTRRKPVIRHSRHPRMQPKEIRRGRTRKTNGLHAP
jgi:hypothetical protein